MAVTRTERLTRVTTTVLSAGLNLVIERFRLDPRLRYAVMLLIAANEIRGLVVVYEIGDAAFGIL